MNKKYFLVKKDNEIITLNNDEIILPTLNEDLMSWEPLIGFEVSENDFKYEYRNFGDNVELVAKKIN